MRALSIRQPWAWLILHGGKDIENRDWRTNVRGRVLIHASKGMTRDEYAGGYETCQEIAGLTLPRLERLERGGIVGAADIVDCVNRSDSPWFFGTFGFVLRNVRPLPFTPYKGALGFFDVPETVLAQGNANE